MLKLPSDYYSSKNLTDFIIESIDANHHDNKPFFAYLAYQAPHGPFAIPEDWRDRCQGRYDPGYDVIRNERLERQKTLGIANLDAVTFPRLPNIPAWELLSDQQRRFASRKMEIYAAMVEYMEPSMTRCCMSWISCRHFWNRQALMNLWEEYVKRNGVIVSDAGPFAQREP